MTTKVDGTLGVDHVQGGVGGVVNAGPAFAARRTTIQNVTNNADATVIFTTEDFDIGGVYNPANGRFQPNVAGYYQVSAAFISNSDGELSAAALMLLKNGASNMASAVQYLNGSAAGTRSVSFLIYMNGSTDYLEVVATLTGTVALYVDAAASRPATFSAFLARAA
jgi:hypothetical protein